MILNLFTKNDRISMSFTEGETLGEIFARNQIHMPFPCGGNHTCGKCLVRYHENAPEPEECEQTLLTEEQSRDGWRLACVSKPKSDCIVWLQDEKKTDIVTSFQRRANEETREKVGKNGIAIDIGTTTIAFSLVQRGHVTAMTSAINSQSIYGADVISRIKAAGEGKAEELRELIRKDLADGIRKIARQAQDTIDEIVIAGNTTMLHILCGYSCESLGSAPFTPVSILSEHRILSDIIPGETLVPDTTPVYLMPGISAFVGADILAGLFYLKAWEWEKPCLLLDLGTNGEMVIGTRHKMYATSAAAGPAFEGGGLSCGMGSVDGAICSVTFEHAVPKVKTIGESEPVGICGTGIVEALCGMRDNEYIDTTGLLKEPYFTEGFSVYSAKSVFINTIAEEEREDIRITQKDIREIQMAKSAIRSALEALLRESGCTYDDIDHVYLAGGFGYRLDVEKAASIGLIPKELTGRTEAVGNTSLGGAVECLLSPELVQKQEEIVAATEPIELAEEKEFLDDYMKYMFFC